MLISPLRQLSSLGNLVIPTWTQLTLADPYNDVIKITANVDSEFKFNINNAILYSESEVYAKIDSVLKLNPNEDKLSVIFRWLTDNFDIVSHPLKMGGLIGASLLAAFNSYPYGNCAAISMVTYRVLNHYFPAEGHMAQLTVHQTNYTNDAYLDASYHVMAYKDYYVEANIDEVIADIKLFSEPLRQQTNHILDMAGSIAAYHAMVAGYFEEVGGEAYIDDYYSTDFANADNLTMKLPKDATFIFPVKTVNIPIADGVNMSHWGNGVISMATGKAGIVSMPFILLQVTGTGTVKIDGITYTLPTDEAALKTVLQGYTKYYNSFEVLTNTAGITAEYLINPSRLLLYQNNIYSKGIISGNIKIESVATAMPVPTIIMAVNKGDADSWTINHDQYKILTGNVKIPIGTLSKIFRCTFSKTGIKLPLSIQFLNSVADSTSTITAGTSVIDQCFAAKLTPGDETLTTSLELTLTTYDGSSCYYTLDGSTPDATKTLYTVPFTITDNTTIKWINIKADYADSHITSRTIIKSAVLEALTFTNKSSGFIESPTGTWGKPWGGYAVATKSLIGDGWIQADIISTIGLETAIGLSTDNTLAPHEWSYTLYVYGGIYHATNPDFSDVYQGITAIIGDKIRLKRTGDVITAEYYRSGAWHVLYTFTTTSSATLYLKVENGGDDVPRYVVNPKGYNVQ